ncbi:UNVERIFIED_CONTAM: hypothetical protein RMT77_008306 [Armadillidium vulgare]
MVRKLYRNCLRAVWIFCIFYLYIYFHTTTPKTYHRKYINIPLDEFPPLEYKIIEADLNLPSVVNNFPIKGESILETKYPINAYYRLLNEYTGVCRKLARFGGAEQCRERNETQFYLDGHKIICVEPELQLLKSSKTEECLVLSFGIMLDISFDFSVREANCEVHMFDVVNFEPFLDIDETFMTFHEIGLGNKNSELIYTNKNFKATFNTLEYILYNINATSRLINILKIDIEGNEWKVFDYLLNKSLLLGAVGQIAVEVHDVRDINTSVSESYKDKLRILTQLEEAGFRRVQYQDNMKSVTVIDEFGLKHSHAGELLLVNTNWYDEDYLKDLKESLKQVKYKFINKF